MQAPGLPAVYKLADTLDAANRRIGQLAAWLALALVAVVFAVVVLRYGMDIGSIALQEFAQYLHGALFLLAAAWTFSDDKHVRVDIFYAKMPARRRAWVNLLGTLLLLLPFSIFILWSSWGYVAESWRLLERSSAPGGLPTVYLFKSLILVVGVQLLAQGIAYAARQVRELTGPA